MYKYDQSYGYINFQIYDYVKSTSIYFRSMSSNSTFYNTVKILKIGTPEIITIIVLQLEQLDFTVQYCLQKMQTE